MNAEKQKTILLVDDEVIIAMAEKMALEKYGYQVIIASTGEEAMAMVEKTPAIDLILMDINLGAGMDGTEAAAAILKDRDLPVVFLSSHMEPEIVARTERVTSYGYVVKDSSITVLDASIKMAFKLFEAKMKEREKESQREAAFVALRENEQLLNFHVNNSPLATLELTSDFIVKRWSGEAEKLFGWNRSETIGKPLMDLKMIYDEDIPIVQEIMERLSEGSSKNIVSTNRNYTKAGKVIICEWYNSVLLDPQGKMISIMSRGIDVSERRQAEATLRGSEERYKALFDRSLDLIYIHDFEGRFIDANNAALNRLGYTREEIRDLNFASLLSEDQLPLAFKTLQEIRETGFQKDLAEFRLRHKNGSQVHVETQGSAILSKGSFSAIQAIARDISERKRAEEELKKSEYLLKEAQKVAHIGHWELDPKIGRPTWSEEIFHIFGLDPKKDEPSFVNHETHLHPDDWPILNMAVTKTSADGSPFDIQFRIVQPSGKIRWMHALGTATMAANGVVSKLFGTAQDISERKQVESQKEAALAALQVSLEKYRVLFESFPLGITISDKSGKIVEGNIQSEQLLGITRDVHTQRRIDSKEWQIIRNDGTPMPAAEYASARALKENRLIKNVEMGIVKDKGEITWISVTAAPIPLEGYGVAITYSDISERRQAEDALRQSEEKYRLIFNREYDAIVVTDADSLKFLDVNGAAVNLYGYSKKEFLGMTALDLSAEPEKSQFTLRAGAETDGVRVPVRKHRKKDGTIFTVEITAGPFILDNQKAVCSIIRDITERKRVEEELSESETRYRELFDNMSSGVAMYEAVGNGEDFIFKDFNRAGERLDGTRKEDVIGKSIFQARPGIKKFGLVEVFKRVFATGIPEFYLNKFYQDERMQGWYDNFVYRLPSGEIVAVYDNISERKQAESQKQATLEALRKSEERYRALVETASDLVYRTDKAGHFTYVNRAALTTTGYEERELIGKLYPTLIHPNIRKKAIKLFLSQIKNGTHNTYSEFPILTKDGREIWLGQNTQLIKEDGRVTGLQAVSRDINARKLAEASLEQALNWQQMIFEGSRDAIFISDQDSRFVAVNNSACDLTGYSREQLLKMRIPDIHDLLDLGAYKLYHQRIFAGEEILSEAKILRSDSAKIDTEFSNRCVSIAGKLYMHTTARDITDRKQAEETLRKSEEKLHEAQELAHIGVWEWETATDTVTWTEELYRIAGLDPMRPAPTYAEHPTIYAPESWKLLEAAVTRTLATSEPYQLELKLIRPDGSSRYVNAFGGAKQDSDGRVNGLYGTVQDISERKLAEEEIKRQLAEKETLLKEVHHRIKNNIASIGGLISLHMQAVTNPEAVAVLQDASSRVNSMRLLYDKLLLTEDYKDLSVKNYLDDLIDTIIAIFPDKAKIIIKKQIADFQLDPKRLFPLGSIINELLTNKMKYAFINRKTGIIKISLTKADNHVTLTIQDDGKGLPAGFDINETKGFGLMLVKMLSQQLGGSFSIKKHKGTKCEVEFDI